MRLQTAATSGGEYRGALTAISVVAGPLTIRCPVKGTAGEPYRMVIFGGATATRVQSGTLATTGWNLLEFITTATATTSTEFYIDSLAAKDWLVDAVQVEQKAYATSFVIGTRAASSASLAMDEPVSVACWYREAYSGSKAFAYLSSLGQLGDYGDISYAAGDLTLSTDRNLVIGPFAAFDRELTAGEQAILAASQDWSLETLEGGSKIIMPLSARRRRR
jgi:hypothetical protein